MDPSRSRVLRPLLLSVMWVTAALGEPTDTRYSLPALIERAYENDAELAGSKWRVKGSVDRQRQARDASTTPILPPTEKRWLWMPGEAEMESLTWVRLLPTQDST